MVNFLGQKQRVELNGFDVSHITSCSIGDVGLTMDTFQVLGDSFDHDIEIEEEASGTFDIVTSDASEGDQRFKEMFQYVFGYVDLDITTDVTTDSITPTSEDFTALDTQGDYTGSRFMTKYRRLSAGDAYSLFDATNDTVWIRFKAMAEEISNVGFVWSYTGGGSGNKNVMRATIFNELSFGNEQIGETEALASANTTTTTLRDAGILTAADNSFIGATIKFLSGGNTGLTRTVTDSDSSDAEVTFAAVPTAPAIGDKYMIYGVPSDTGLSGAGNHDIDVDHNTYDGGPRWKVETAPTTWDGMTIGKYYWIRLYRQTHSGAGDAQLRIDTGASTTSEYGALWSRSTDTDALGGSTVVADSEAIHYIKFKTTEGLNVVVFDYIDQAETGGLKWTFNKVKLESVTPSFANRQATRGTISWKCNDWAFDEIT